MKLFFASVLALVLSAGSVHAQGRYTGKDLEKLTSKPEQLVIMKTRQGIIKLQLFDKIAPRHVKAFLGMIDSGFYDGTTFHRVIDGFMIQGGCPNSKNDSLSDDGAGQAWQPTIPLERSKLTHERGILGMARKQDENSATSQFFIMHGSAPHLDYYHTIFGQVVEGMDVVDRIVSLPMEAVENPGKAAEIIRVTVEEDESRLIHNASKKK